MQTSSESKSNSSNEVRRPRITTVCTTCRDRRMKCDRVKPRCSQCSRGDRNCTYMDCDPPRIAFINKSRVSVMGDADSTPSSDTWTSIIEQQADLLTISKNGEDNGGHQVSIWAIAEGEEPLRPHNSRSYQGAQPSDGIPVRALGEKFLSSLGAHLLPQDICRPFFESFILNIHPIIPICHLPTLKREYEYFWTSLSQYTSVESIILVLAILYTGSSNSKLAEIRLSSQFLDLYEEVFRIMDISSYHFRHTASSIQLLQGYIILNTFKSSQLAPFCAFGFLAQAIRYAQTLRLHIDPKNGSPPEVETQRRIWWHLIFMDVESIIANGLPPIIRSNEFTTQLPSILQDHAISADSSSIPRLEDLSPMMIAMQGHYQWAHHMLMWFQRLPSHEEAKHFSQLINNLILLMPNSAGEGEWAKTYLLMQIDRAYCMLGLRFWQVDKYKETGCHSEVISTARSFLIHYHALSLPHALQTSPSSRPDFNWFIPGILQPLHAMVIVLMHISICPDLGREENLSRSLLEGIFTIRRERILSGGVFPANPLFNVCNLPGSENPRYLMLVNLWRKVWRSVGWDGAGAGAGAGAAMDLVIELGGARGDQVHTTAENIGSGGIHSNTSHEGEVVVKQKDNESIDKTCDAKPEDVMDDAGLDLLDWDEWESLTQGLFAS